MHKAARGSTASHLKNKASDFKWEQGLKWDFNLQIGAKRGQTGLSMFSNVAIVRTEKGTIITIPGHYSGCFLGGGRAVFVKEYPLEQLIKEDKE